MLHKYKWLTQKLQYSRKIGIDISSEKQPGSTGLKILLRDCSCERKRKNVLQRILLGRIFIASKNALIFSLQGNQTDMGCVKELIEAFLGHLKVSVTMSYTQTHTNTVALIQKQYTFRHMSKMISVLPFLLFTF